MRKIHRLQESPTSFLLKKEMQGDISFDNIRSVTDVAGIVRNRIKHFFEHHKDLDKDKRVNDLEWGDIEIAKKLIEESAKRNSSN